MICVVVTALQQFQTLLSAVRTTPFVIHAVRLRTSGVTASLPRRGLQSSLPFILPIVLLLECRSPKRSSRHRSSSRHRRSRSRDRSRRRRSASADSEEYGGYVPRKRQESPRREGGVLLPLCLLHSHYSHVQYLLTLCCWLRSAQAVLTPGCPRRSGEMLVRCFSGFSSMTCRFQDSPLSRLSAADLVLQHCRWACRRMFLHHNLPGSAGIVVQTDRRVQAGTNVVTYTSRQSRWN